MKTTIELTEQEQSIIENALNAYWNDAHEQLENKGVMMSDGSKRPLGDIEKAQSKAYAAVNQIKFEDDYVHFRTDIAAKAINRPKK